MKTLRFNRSAHRPKASFIEPLEGRLAPSIITPLVTSIDRATPATVETGAASVVFAVTFNQAVTGVDAADFEVFTSGDAKAGSISVETTGNPAVFNVTVSGLQGNGEVRLDLVDNDSITETSGGPEPLPLGGFGLKNGSFTGDSYHLLQTMPKVVSIATTPPNPTSNSTLAWTVTFTEEVSGVDASDFTLIPNGPMVSGTPTVTPINPNGARALSFTVSVSGVSGAGTVGLNLLDDESIRDADNNPLQTNPVSFGAVTTLGAGSSPVAIASGDLDGDGFADIVVANISSDNVSVLLGNGNGTFDAAVNYPTGSTPRSVAVADVNGDGIPDIVTTDFFFAGSPTFTTNSVSVLIGNGDGTFQSRQGYGFTNPHLAVTVGDLNGDGKPDIVQTSQSGIGFVNVLLSNGLGGFQSPATYTTGNDPRSVVIADVDNDGIPDILTANYQDNTVSVLRGLGSGTFASATSFVTGISPTSIAVGYLDGDDRLDVVTGNSGQGTPNALPEGPSPITGPSGPSVSVLLNNSSIASGFSTITFLSAVNYTTSGSPSGVALTDVNGDGELDVVVSNGFSVAQGAQPEQGGPPPNSLVTVLIGAGDGTLGSPLDFSPSQSAASGVVIADFDGDGKADIATANSNTNTAGVLLNEGSGAFTGEVFTIIPPQFDLTVSTVSHTGSNFGGGDAITFTINYANIGSISATGVEITVPLDSHSFFVAGENSGWVRSGDILTKTVGNLTVSGSGSTTLILHADWVVNGFSSSFPVTATISDDGTHGEDIDPKNDSSTDYAYVSEPNIYHGFVVTAPGIAPKNKYAPPVVNVYDRQDGHLIYSFNAYEANYRDSVRVAVGDFNGDGIDDIVTTTQHNGGRMRFFDGSTGQQFSSGPLSQEVPVFGTSKNKGAFVAVGFVNGFDRVPEIVVGSSLISKTVGGGTVKVYSLDSNNAAAPEQGQAVLQVIKEFTPFGKNFKGGIRVAVGDVDRFGNSEQSLPENGKGEFLLDDDIIVGQGYRGATVKVYKGTSLLETANTAGGDVPTALLGLFKVGSPKFKGGVSVGVGDFNDDGRADIMVGTNTGKPSVVQIFDGISVLNGEPTQIIPTITPFDPSYRFGVRVASADVNGDGIADIITSVGIKNQSLVQFYVSQTQSGTGQVTYVLDDNRTIRAYSTFPNVALWIAGSSRETRT